MSLIRNTLGKIRNANVAKGEDIGLDRGAQQGRQRTINADGSYNIKRITGDTLNLELFHWLINTSWKHYWIAVFLFYGGVNVIFATIYLLIGVEFIYGIVPADGMNDFLHCFFFSNQTFTTVGYGGMHPVGLASSWVASLEAFVGLMSFALATGTLYGRFSRATSAIKYSKNALIAPFRDGISFQFMVANQKKSNLMELEVTSNFSWVDKSTEQPIRQFTPLKYDVSKIAMFPTSWTIVHAINEESPFYGMRLQDMIEAEIEVFILIKGFDESYSQTIYSRSSYTAKDFVFGGKFIRPFYVDESGMLVMDLTKVGNWEKVEIENAVTVLN